MTRSTFLLTIILGGAVGLAGCTPPSPSPGTTAQPAVATDQKRQEQSASAASLAGREPGRGRRWQQQAVSAVTLTADERKSIDLRTARVSRGAARTELRAMGRLMAPQTRMAIISYPFSARVGTVHVQLGEWVREGQPLVTLQSEAVGTARADYYTALADEQLAEQAFERESMLLKGGVGSQKNHQASEAAVKVAQARLEAAEKKLHLLGFTEEQVKTLREQHEISPIITLHAPIAGKVVASRAVLGAVVDQSVEILTLIDPTVLWVDAEIYERDIARIRMGQQVNLTVPAYPGERFQGRVGYIGDVVKDDTQTIVVRADVVNQQSKLKPGMFASVNFVLAEAARALVVPRDAVLDDDGEAMVFVVAGDRFVPKAVRLGSETDGSREVIDGLTEGEEVVTSGGFQLRSKLFDAVLKAGIH
jgi:cobalt-zinc-cadmium efflux system membrane fusion protein